MQNLPNIVRERLRAGVSVANHPDADVLTAFTEKALPQLERDIVLEHLARCDDCRDVVALALPEPELAGATVSPSPKSWLTWPALRWGFATAGVVAIVALGVSQYQRREQSMMVAKESTRSENMTGNVQPEAPSAKAPAAVEKREHDQLASSNAAPNALLDMPPATDLKLVAPPLAQQVPAHRPPVQNGVVGRAMNGSAAPGGPAMRWQQQTQQTQLSATTSAAAKQQTSDMAANLKIQPATPTLEAQPSGAPASVDAESRSEADSRSDYSSGAVGRAKPPVPSASGADVALNGQPGPDQASVRPLRVQVSPGQIGGYVVDPSGAVVSNARITITPSNVGKTATAVTDAQGVWLIAGLPSGSYKAQAEAQGFKTTVLDFDYDARQSSMYSFTLSPGSVSETVEVAAQGTQLQTETSAVGGAVTASGRKDLPLNARNFTALTNLTPEAAASGAVARWSISAGGTLQRSFDLGKTWQNVDVRANSSDSASLAIVAKSYAGKEAEADKKSLKQPPATLVFRAVAANGSDVWAGGSGGAVFHSLDAGNHWTRVVPSAAGSMLTGDILSLEFSDAQHGRITTSSAEVWTTTDDGASWQKQ